VAEGARERTLATDLQRRMLPAVTSAPGFDVVARYLPAATEVGGDWLDVIELTGGRTAFVIGDVMGRGVPAATTMAQVRTAVRAYALLDLPPADVLQHTSLLATEMPGRQFVTCVYAVHDPVEGTLTYANAGHPGPAVVSPGGEVRFLHERLGMPLRVGESYAERVIAFPAGSALVLYTDGLVERRGRPLPEGRAELAAALGDLVGAATDPEAACDRLIRQLTGGAPDDDVAVLFARDTGQQRQVAVMPLTAEPNVAQLARRFVTGALVEWKLTGHQDAAAMVATELISNAVRHSHPVALRLQHAGGRLMIEVVDADDRQPRRMEPSVHEENHRGLFIVDSLARGWGTRRTPNGKVVWAELAVG